MSRVPGYRLLAGCALALLLGACGTTKTGDMRTESDNTTDQNRASIRLQLASGYYERGQHEVALDEVKKAIVFDPNNAEAYGMRGLIYMAMNEPERADESFLYALKLAPQNPDLSNNYGSFLCKTGRAKESIAYFDTALGIRNYRSPVSALNNAGSCSMKIKDSFNAERYLLQAMKLQPDVAPTNANLARIYLERGDLERAGFYVGRLAKLVKVEDMSADLLWLSARIQHKLGDKALVASLGTQLRRHHAKSPEYAAFQRGAFNE